MMFQFREAQGMSSERFSSSEKQLLVNLVFKYKNILANKKTDAVSRAAKVRSWQEIEYKFNTHGYVNKRPWKSLRKAWENMKARRKIAIAQETFQRVCSGGEPSTSSKQFEPSPEFEVDVSSMAPYVENTGDSDMLQESQDILFEFVDDLSEGNTVKTQETHHNKSSIQGKSLYEVHNLNNEPVPAASTSRTHITCVSRSAAVARELDIRVKKVTQSMEYEALLYEKRMKAAELDIKIKEDQLKHQENTFALEMRMMEEKAKRLKEAHETLMLQQQLQHERIMENLHNSGGSRV